MIRKLQKKGLVQCHFQLPKQRRLLFDIEEKKDPFKIWYSSAHLSQQGFCFPVRVGGKQLICVQEDLTKSASCLQMVLKANSDAKQKRGRQVHYIVFQLVFKRLNQQLLASQ